MPIFVLLFIGCGDLNPTFLYPPGLQNQLWSQLGFEVNFNLGHASGPKLHQGFGGLGLNFGLVLAFV